MSTFFLGKRVSEDTNVSDVNTLPSKLNKSFCIGLVGASGVGKSRLINTVLNLSYNNQENAKVNGVYGRLILPEKTEPHAVTNTIIRVRHGTGFSVYFETANNLKLEVPLTELYTQISELVCLESNKAIKLRYIRTLTKSWSVDEENLDEVEIDDLVFTDKAKFWIEHVVRLVLNTNFHNFDKFSQRERRLFVVQKLNELCINAKVRYDNPIMVHEAAILNTVIHLLIQEAVVVAPCEILAGGIELVDMPAIGTSDVMRTHTVNAAMANVDLVICVLGEKNLGDSSLLDYLKPIKTQLANGEITLWTIHHTEHRIDNEEDSSSFNDDAELCKQTVGKWTQCSKQEEEQDVRESVRHICTDIEPKFLYYECIGHVFPRLCCQAIQQNKPCIINECGIVAWMGAMIQMSKSGYADNDDSWLELGLGACMKIKNKKQKTM